MTKQLGVFSFLAAFFLATALSLVTNQSLVLLHAPATLRLVLDVCLGIGTTMLGTFVIGFIVGINNMMDDMTGGMFSKMSGSVIFGAALSALTAAGLIWLLASLLHMAGFAFAYVVLVVFVESFLIAMLSLKRIAGTFSFFSNFLSPGKRK